MRLTIIALALLFASTAAGAQGIDLCYYQDAQRASDGSMKTVLGCTSNSFDNNNALAVVCSSDGNHQLLLSLLEKHRSSRTSEVLVRFGDGEWLDRYFTDWHLPKRGNALVLETRTNDLGLFLGALGDVHKAHFIVKHAMGAETFGLSLGSAFREKADRLRRECGWG